MTAFSLEHHIASIIEEKVQPLKKEISELKKLITNSGTKEYYSAKEVKTIYGISSTTLWRHCQNGRLHKHFIHGKTVYKKSELDSFIQEY